MVAEDGEDAKRRLELRQGRRDLGHADPPRHEAMPGQVIAEHDDHVGAKPVGGGDDLFDPRHRHMRLAGMEIGEHGEA